MDAGDGAVEVGQRVGGAGDRFVHIIFRSSAVVAGASELGAELVERDAGLQQLGLQVAQGLTFHPLGGVGVQVAGCVEGGLGAEPGCQVRLSLGRVRSIARLAPLYQIVSPAALWSSGSATA